MVGLKSTSQKEQTFEKLPIPCLVEAGASVLHRRLKFGKKCNLRKIQALFSCTQRLYITPK